jgi:RluA family pseudouridine synthase
VDNNNPPFKKPSKKHTPYGLTILYEDRDIIVVSKINGLLTVSTDKEKSKTAFSLLNDYVRKGNSRSKNRVFIVHRLDRDTSGVLVFAKTEIAKRFLQDNWKDFDKTYYTVVHGKLEEKQGLITSYLMENKAHKVYSTKDESKGKLSKTGFKVIKETKNLSLLEIELFTGRKNQIRAHLSEKGHPVVGDKAYGTGDNARQLALHAATLTIAHPYSKKKITFETELPLYFKTLIKI